MLSLSAAHIRIMRESNPKQRLIWVDIGGGTGHNIELMDKHFPISSFDAIYLVDLCEPLLQVARKRFAERGWMNVVVLCQDASEFSLPEWAGKDPKGTIGFVTLSYSLSMVRTPSLSFPLPIQAVSQIPNFYTLLDRISYTLSPSTGLLSVVDFYTSGKQPSLHERAIGGEKKECGWLSRWFWQIWFDFDHVSLSPLRRDYLEYKFGTVRVGPLWIYYVLTTCVQVKSYNGRNRFIFPFIVRM